MINKTFIVRDMFCEQCENIISGNLLKIDGVQEASASLKKGTVDVTYDQGKCTDNVIIETITRVGYTVAEENRVNTLANGISILVIIFGLWYIVNAFGLNTIFQRFPQATEGMSYAMLFLIGLLTSFHCVAMCGGLNLAGSLQNKRASKQAALYNVGRLFSYTVIGGLLGALGSVIAITLRVRAAVGIVAGVIMIFMGMKLMNCFPFMKKFHIPMPVSLKRRFLKRGNGSSFYIGLINGFMPCGPLQTMQLLSIASGSFIKGSLSMFFFCLGTMPLMVVFGLIAGALKSKWKNGMALVGGTLIVVFGVYMLQNNFALTGINPFHRNVDVYTTMMATQEGASQEINTVLQPGSYDSFTVKAGVPLQWTITADKSSLNGCNSEIIIPSYDIDIKLHEGENIVSFTPKESGTINYSCWMGMIRAEIFVVD